MNLDQQTIDAVSTVGELLIRACATLATLSDEQLAALQQATHGNLPDSLVFGLRAARAVSPQIQESMLAHPPKPLLDAVF